MPQSEVAVTDQLLKAVRKKVNLMTIDAQKVRTRLEAKRTELQYEIAELTFEEASSGKQGQGVEDTGETAQTFQEVQLDESILQNERHLLADVEEALRRLQDGTYGRCLTCGQPIPDRRLEAIPWAVRDVKCEEQLVSLVRGFSW
jgi:DnaK suppressor protein